MNQLQRNFSKAAADYEAKARFQRIQCARVADAALMLLPPKAHVLDVGCGTALFTQMTAAKRPGWNILGLDIAPGMCAAAANHGAVLQADAVNIPLANASVDAVVSSLCLQWIEEPTKAFAEIQRILRPGGWAIVATLGYQTLRELRAAGDAAALSLALLPMKTAAEYRASVARANLHITAYSQALEVEHYASVNALLGSMRDIGAGNHMPHAGGSLTGASRWKAMLKEYEALRNSAGLPATWDVHFMILRKPA